MRVTPIRDDSGENGGLAITDTNAHTGNWNRLTVLTDAVIATVTGNTSGLNGATVKAGTSIDGVFTAVTMTSGTVYMRNRQHQATGP